MLEILIVTLFPVSLHFLSLCLSHRCKLKVLFFCWFLGHRASSLCSLAWLVIWHVAQAALAPMTLLPYLTALLSNKVIRDTP